MTDEEETPYKIPLLRQKQGESYDEAATRWRKMRAEILDVRVMWLCNKHTKHLYRAFYGIEMKYVDLSPITEEVKTC